MVLDHVPGVRMSNLRECVMFHIPMYNKDKYDIKKKIIGRQESNMKHTHLLNEINVVKSTVNKLSSSSGKSKVITSNFDPILMPFNLCQLSVGNVIIPNL